MKRILALLLIGCLLLSVSACGGTAPANKTAKETPDTEGKTEEKGAEVTTKEGPLKCGIILDWMGASLFVEAVNNIKKVAGTMDVEIITWDCQISPESMIQGLENFISADVDMIYLQNWTGYDAIKDVVQKALEKGIVIVAYDDEVEGAIYCTMADMKALGYALGDAAIKVFEKYSKAEDDTIVIIAAMNTEYSVTRTNLAVEKIQQKLPKANIVKFDVVSYGGSGNAAGMQIGESLISTYDDVVAIVATDSANTALGVAEAYTAAGIKDGLGVVTNDGSLEEFKAIAEDSVFYATVDLGLVELMTDLFVRGIKYIRTGEYDESKKLVYFYNDIVSKENIDKYYNAETGERILAE